MRWHLAHFLLCPSSFAHSLLFGLSQGKQGEPGPSGKAGLPGTPVSTVK